MSDIEREAFERWYSQEGEYGGLPLDHHDEDGDYVDDFVQSMWMAWQAARKAPASGEVEQAPIVWINPVNLKRTMIASSGETVEVSAYREGEFTAPLYTHPPSKVPEGDELKALLNDAVESGYRYGMGRGHMPDEPRRGIVAEIMEGLTTPTTATTAGAEWVKCEEDDYNG